MVLVGFLQNSIEKHILTFDKYLCFKRFTKKTLSEWFLPLIESITEEGAVPYLLDTKKRYRASPLSSLIIWLNKANLLPKEAVDVLHDKLIYLRDNCETNDSDKGTTNKEADDNVGWSLCEGVSVWSTSMAIIALLDCEDEIDNTKVNGIKETILWLTKQQDATKKGWGYQSYRNCQINSVMTSLAVYALSLAYDKVSVFNFDKDEIKSLLTAISRGYEYLSENLKRKRKYCYWEFDGKPNCFATTWSLIAIRKVSQLDIQINKEAKELFNNTKIKSFDFILSTMPRTVSYWKSEQFVYEAGAKYNKQKNYYSFTPTLLLLLIDLGLSPYHSKVINQINWLIDNQSQWKIAQYDQEKICTFTYAMCIATITKWVQHVGNINAVLLTQKAKATEKIYSLIVGMPFFKDQPIILLKKSRLWYLFIIVIISAISIIYGSFIFTKIKQFIMYILHFKDDITVNVIASFIYFIICSVMAIFFNFSKKILGGKIHDK